MSLIKTILYDVVDEWRAYMNKADKGDRNVIQGLPAV